MQNSKMLRNNNIWNFIAVVAIILFFQQKCLAQSNKSNHVKWIKQIFDYEHKDIIEEYTYIGVIHLTSSYKVFNCFKKVKAAQSYHGHCFLVFLSPKDTLVYILDYISDFPENIKKDIFYRNDKSTRLMNLPNPLCLFDSCFEMEKQWSNVLRSLRKLK